MDHSANKPHKICVPDLVKAISCIHNNTLQFCYLPQEPNECLQPILERTTSRTCLSGPVDRIRRFVGIRSTLIIVLVVSKPVNNKTQNRRIQCPWFYTKHQREL